jgi:hypothetical protein
MARTIMGSAGLNEKCASNIRMNYKKTEKIGSGGFGEVWKCQRVEGAFVAIKFLLQVDEDSKARFKREVGIQRSLDHPNIVKVLDDDLECATPWYATELYECSLLDQLPQLVGDGKQIATVVEQILTGLQFAHEHSVIHRDLKPANVLCSRGRYALSDFGLGRKLDAMTTRVTMTGDRFGTLEYMAPEQFRDSKRVDHRADIFSFGVMLRELFTGDTFPEASNLPLPIRMISERCTQIDPASRYQTAEEVKAAFKLFTSTPTPKAEEQLTALIPLLQAGTASVENLGRVIALIPLCQQDDELMFKVFMGMQPYVFKVLCQMAIDVMKLGVNRFAEVTRTRSFAFSETDYVGDKCRSLFDSTTDPELRAELTALALDIGVAYNRWHVMRVAAGLIEEPKTPHELPQLLKRLETRRSELFAIESYLTTSKLEPLIRVMLETRTEGAN